MRTIINRCDKIKYEGSSKNGYWIIVEDGTQNVHQSGTQNVRQKNTNDKAHKDILKIITSNPKDTLEEITQMVWISSKTVHRIISSCGRINRIEN